MEKFLNNRNRLSVVLVFGVCAVVMSTCRFPTGVPKLNTPPDTRLSNVPANDTTAQYILRGAIPEQTLQWVGDDQDGFIVAYQYRWTDSSRLGKQTTPWTSILNITSIGGIGLDTLIIVHGTPHSFFRIYNFLATLNPSDAATRARVTDSLKTGRPFAVPYHTGFVPGDSIAGANRLINEAPTKGTFIFPSPSDSNMHRFEVASIDNNDAVDPTPARAHFWTLPSPGPIIDSVIGPLFPTAAVTVIRYPTEKNPGLAFSVFRVRDPSTDQREFSWVVDDTSDPARWSPWSVNPQRIVTASQFSFINPGAVDTHMIHVRAKNRWGVVSPVFSRRFLAIVPHIDDPAWPKRTLIINNNRIVMPGGVDSTIVKAFYAEVLDSIGKTGRYDFWTTTSQSPYASLPGRAVLSRYSSVLFLFEQTAIGPPFGGTDGLRRFDQTEQALIREYLNIGGKLIYVGTPNIAVSIINYGDWADSVFHIVSQSRRPFTQNTELDFIGAKGLLGYPDLRLDSSKFSAPDSVAIRNIAVNYPRGFGQTISLFDSKRDSAGFENAPLGVRYLAPPAIPPARPTYSVVHFGFPLYYANKSDVIQAMRKAFEDIKE